MPQVAIARWGEHDDLERAAETFMHWNPGFLLGSGATPGSETVLTPEHGGVRYMWLLSGRGEAWLEHGYRTQEGDGRPLPTEYVPDPLDPQLTAALDCLERERAGVHPRV